MTHIVLQAQEAKSQVSAHCTSRFDWEWFMLSSTTGTG
jgi:hypothetical protein